jgi:hypothetical protein
MFVNGSSIDASYQVSVHLAERFQRRRLKCERVQVNHTIEYFSNLTQEKGKIAKANLCKSL